MCFVDTFLLWPLCPPAFLSYSVSHPIITLPARCVPVLLHVCRSQLSSLSLPSDTFGAIIESGELSIDSIEALCQSPTARTLSLDQVRGALLSQLRSFGDSAVVRDSKHARCVRVPESNH